MNATNIGTTIFIKRLPFHVLFFSVPT